MVAGKAAIADSAHFVPILHCGVGALDADPNARSRLVEPCLPVDQRLVAPRLIGDPVLNPHLGELGAQHPPVVGLVGVIDPSRKRRRAKVG